MSGAAQGRIRRAVRWFTLGSGALKRGSDRVQMLARFVVALSVVAAPALAVGVAGATRTHFDAVAVAQAIDRRQVRAVVLKDPAPEPVPWNTTLVSEQATVAWDSERGIQRGVVPVPDGTAPGTTVPVWIGRDGQPTLPPLDGQDIGGLAVAAAAGAGTGLPLVAWLLYRFLCAGLDVQRQRRWTQDWVVVERTWRAPR
jgi:hypothetical protein